MLKQLIAGLTLVALFSPSLVYTTEQVSAEAEFKRALSIIEQTQLEIFTDTTPADSIEIFSHFQKRWSQADNHSGDAKDNERKLELIRDSLSDTIDSYNDQYANYISPQALKKYRERRSGSYHGVGLKFRARRDQYPVVIGPLIGGPLEKSDLQPGDRILSAGSYDLKGTSSAQIIKLLKGPKDSTVELTVNRNGTIHQVDARRGPVDLRYSHAEIISANIGYLKISRFGGNTHEHVRTQLNSLIDKHVQGIVLDLRDNPGGSTRAARAVVSMFTTEQHVYCERYKSGKIKKLPRHGDHMTDLPLAILVNGQSMSSSEIVAGALQSYGRGIVIGSPTFGKGLVQKVFNLSQPLGGAIRTTIAVFGTPDEKPIHATGIVPDIFIESEADFMFRRTGSLNIRADARQYQRELLEQRVTIDFPDKAHDYISASDVQLNTATAKLAELNKLTKLQAEH